MNSLRIHHSTRLRPIHGIESIPEAFCAEDLAHRAPRVELLPARSLRLLHREHRGDRLQDSEYALLFDSATVSIPLRSSRLASGRDAWSIDIAPPDSLALISPRALTRLAHEPVFLGLMAGLISCLVLEPCLASAAEPGSVAAFVVEPPQRTEGPKKEVGGLPDSVFQVALKQRVSISLPGMDVTGTILALDESTVTFLTEADGNILAIQRTDISAIRLLENKQAAAKESQPPPSGPDPFSESRPETIDRESLDDWESPNLRVLLDEAELSAKSGMNWKAYLAYKEALELSSRARARTVTDEITLIEGRMRRIGLGLWIPGTVLTVAGFAMLPSIWLYGGVSAHVVGIPMLVVGAIMHSRASRMREELPVLKRRYSQRTRWNGGLSWSF